MPDLSLASRAGSSLGVAPGPPLVVVPLGGTAEFGLSSTLYALGSERIVVDCGAMFPDERMLGVDLVLPDLRALAPPAPPPLAYLLTHGHEDHIGALGHALRVAPAPVFGTALTLALAERRLAEGYDGPKARLVPLVPGREISLGSAFVVEPIRVAHSIPEAVSFAIRTPKGLVLHTGDYKWSGLGLPALGTDRDRFAALGLAEGGVRLLVGDSTGSLDPGTSPPEESVAQALDAVFSAARGRVLVAIFSSHVERLATLATLATRHGRRFGWDGRRLRETAETAARLGLLRVPPGPSLDRLAALPPDQMALAITGAQGEPGSVLDLLASGGHPRLSLGPGDTLVVSARILPASAGRVAALLDRLCDRGVLVVDPQGSPDVHCSGHGRREDLAEMLRLARPKALLPVHGRRRMLHAHAALGRALGVPEVLVPENGDVVELDAQGMRLAGRLPAGRIFVDGKGVGDVEETVLEDRRALGETGAVVAHLFLSPDTGDILRPPALSALGISGPKAQAELLDRAAAKLLKVLQSLPPASRRDPAQAADRARRELRRFFRRELNRRPVVIPVILPT